MVLLLDHWKIIEDYNNASNLNGLNNNGFHIIGSEAEIKTKINISQK